MRSNHTESDVSLKMETNNCRYSIGKKITFYKHVLLKFSEYRQLPSIYSSIEWKICLNQDTILESLKCGIRSVLHIDNSCSLFKTATVQYRVNRIFAKQ